MSGGAIVLAVNMVVAGMFAASYFIVAFTNRSQRRAFWFGAVYVIGMVSPAVDFLSAYSRHPAILEFIGYASFLAATLAMSAAFAAFQCRRPPWLPIAVIFAIGAMGRISIAGWPHDTLGYGFAYQLPLVFAALLAVRSVIAAGGRDAFHVSLAGVFTAIAADLFVKPFLAVRLGPGATFKEYSSTNYALVSQASTGFLLLAAGIILLLIVAQQAIVASQRESETDPLSGIANRRGFDRNAHEMIARADREGRSVSIAMFDLDHFKRVNDTHGHERGDALIAEFGVLLRRAMPETALVARLGGEEFAVLLEESTQREALMLSERLRLEASRVKVDATTTLSVSGGVAERDPGEALAQLMRRADQALYDAKNQGRDRICLRSSDLARPATPAVVVALRGRRSALAAC